MKIRPIDVIRNIENHKDLWDIEGYRLSKAEGEIIVKALYLLMEKEEKENAETGCKKSE